jgi:integrase
MRPGFYIYFRKLQDLCGIPSEDHFGLHQLRKTCATHLWECNPQAAQFALGHTSLETTASFYVRGQDMMALAMDQMPQPSAFARIEGAP